jgi:spore coat protein U-like protein
MNIKFKRNNIKLAIAAGIALSTVTLSMPAYATPLTKSGDMLVQAHVGDHCKISTNTINFGEYDPIVTNATSPLTKKGGIDLTCTMASINSITMSVGDSHGGTLGAGGSASRRMEAANDETNYLAYELYSDSSYSTLFDPTSGVSYTGKGTSDTVEIFAQVFAGQTGVSQDDYEDKILVTITY